MKKPIGLTAISAYFLIEGLFNLHKFLKIIQGGEAIGNELIALLIFSGFSVAGIGLFLQKGWGRNLALFFNFYILFNAIRNFLRYFTIDNKITFAIKGSVSLLIATAIFTYLLRRKIKENFTKSPISLFMLGFFLGMYGIFQRTGNALIDYFWLAIAIVGFWIIFKGVKQMRE